MPGPLLISAALSVAGWGLRDEPGGHDLTNDPDTGGASMILDTDGVAAWEATPTTFPVGTWQGYRPTRSQEYRASNHHGVDIMFPRVPGGGADQQFPASTPNGTSKWFMPEGQIAYCVKDGYIWSSGSGPTGLIVVIDHGKPFATCYIHMDSLLIPSGISRGAGHIQIKAGDPIGVIGYSPRDEAKLKHLHFELWYKGGAESHVDPWPILEGKPLPQ